MPVHSMHSCNFIPFHSMHLINSIPFPCIALHIIALRSIPFDAVHSCMHAYTHACISLGRLIQSVIDSKDSPIIAHALSPKLPPHGGLELPSNLYVCRNCKPFSKIVSILYVYTYIRTYIHIAYYMYTYIYIHIHRYRYAHTRQCPARAGAKVSNIRHVYRKHFVYRNCWWAAKE